MPLALARYAVTRVPTYRRNRRHDELPAPPDFGRDLPGDATVLQRLASGTGPVFHRRYWIDLQCAGGPEDVVRSLAVDLNQASPVEVARFDKMSGGEGMHLGDEYVVRMPGPWNGPVRVVDLTDRSFRFATLQGHMEAGEIEFRCDEVEQGRLRFTIDSWARSGDRLFHLLYDRFPLAREIQLHMWAHFCQRVVEIVGGVAMSRVEVQTDQLDPEEVA